jgi:hypothetical protein
VLTASVALAGEHPGTCTAGTDPHVRRGGRQLCQQRQDMRKRREAAFLILWPQWELAGEPHGAGGSEEGRAGGARRLSGQVLLDRVQRRAAAPASASSFLAARHRSATSADVASVAEVSR